MSNIKGEVPVCTDIRVREDDKCIKAWKYNGFTGKKHRSFRAMLFKHTNVLLMGIYDIGENCLRSFAVNVMPAASQWKEVAEGVRESSSQQFTVVFDPRLADTAMLFAFKPLLAEMGMVVPEGHPYEKIRTKY